MKNSWNGWGGGTQMERRNKRVQQKFVDGGRKKQRAPKLEYNGQPSIG
jgi:hypothetical protein